MKNNKNNWVICIVKLLVCSSLFLASCRGGGLHFIGKKPSWCTLRKDFGGFSSKAYKCVNGQFEPIDNTFRCVNGGCNPFAQNGCPWIDVDGNTVIRDKEATHYKAGMYDIKTRWNPYKQRDVKYVEKTPVCCDANNNVVVCGQTVTVTETESTNTAQPPGSELEENVGEFSDDPFLDPLIMSPSKSCTEASSYRLEDGKCVTATNSRDFAVMQSCLDEIYVDNSGLKNSDLAKDSRKFEVGFNIENYSRHYAIAIVRKDNVYSGITKNSVGVYAFEDKLRLKDCNRWSSNATTKKASGILTVDLDVSKSLSDGDILSTVLLLKNEAGTYDPIGTYCNFTVRTKETRTATPTPHQRALNLLIFKNASEADFQSDITQYSYTIPNSESITQFTSAVDNIWKNHLHASNLNYTYATLPRNLVDLNGNVVLWERDIPTYTYIYPNGTRERRKMVFDPSLADNNPTKITPKIFRDSLLGKWTLRLSRYNRLLSGKTDGTISIGTDNNINWTEVKLPVLNDSKGPRDYSNLIGMLVVNSFTILNEAEGVSQELSNQLNNYLEAFKSSNKLHELAPNGATYARPTPYSPICVIYRKLHERFFLVSEPELNGTLITTALHELAHAWYFTGSTGSGYYGGDEGENYFMQHVVYNYMNDKKNCTSDYYCLMKPKPSVTVPTTLQLREYLLQQIATMSYSKGITERLRNVFSATY